eukprot:c1254_g1_i1.p1 GENE.c1254_g1_i1~~c1254_g1_i1.p1  ORF type:complete len:614 (+),score=158.66 c1254_g1_i1:1-1842(+)
MGAARRPTGDTSHCGPQKLLTRKSFIIAMAKKAAKKATNNSSDKQEAENAKLSKKLAELEISPITATGQLCSNPLSYDIKLNNFSLSFHGFNLIVDTMLELTCGRRYGLIGRNGSGKSTFLKCLGRRDVPIPDFVDIYLLDHEADPSDETALEVVMSTKDEVARLEREADRLMETDANSDQLSKIYERLDELDVDRAAPRAASILFGLGFTPEMQRKKTREFSGGWRMRIALARALFVCPALLLLDEPTNHLDLEACVWLEDYLKDYKMCLVVVSHSQDFLNGVCTNIINLHQKQLLYYGGNYDSFIKTRDEKEDAQMKQWRREQDEIAHMKDYIARFGHGSAKLAKQAQSKEKTLAKMEAKGLTEKVATEKVVNFSFTPCGNLFPPVLQFMNVAFSYSGNTKDLLYKDLDLAVDCESRVALVGRNGCGKSTLLKLMVGELNATDGTVRRHTHLKIARYHQHLTEHLDMELTPCEYMMKEFPENNLDKVRPIIGRFGISGDAQMAPIKNLSDGQRSRLVFAWIANKNPHLLLLDEPTNHLDMETIDSLARAINEFDGGMVLVSHDFRLINQVAKEIWLCGVNQGIRKWEGDIASYKEELRKQNNKLSQQALKS